MRRSSIIDLGWISSNFKAPRVPRNISISKMWNGTRPEIRVFGTAYLFGTTDRAECSNIHSQTSLSYGRLIHFVKWEWARGRKNHCVWDKISRSRGNATWNWRPLPFSRFDPGICSLGGKGKEKREIINLRVSLSASNYKVETKPQNDLSS